MEVDNTAYLVECDEFDAKQSGEVVEKEAKKVADEFEVSQEL